MTIKSKGLNLKTTQNLKTTKQREVVDLSQVEEMISHAVKQAKSEAFQEAKIEIDKQVQTDKASLITVFGIFASITSLRAVDRRNY